PNRLCRRGRLRNAHRTAAAGDILATAEPDLVVAKLLVVRRGHGATPCPHGPPIAAFQAALMRVTLLGLVDDPLVDVARHVAHAVRAHARLARARRLALIEARELVVARRDVVAVDLLVVRRRVRLIDVADARAPLIAVRIRQVLAPLAREGPLAVGAQPFAD